MKRTHLRNRRSAFSLLEVIAAVVILAVVAAATVATIAPMRTKAGNKLNEQAAANVTAMAQTYFVEFGTFPGSLQDLATEGYITPAEVDTLATQVTLRGRGRVTPRVNRQ